MTTTRQPTDVWRSLATDRQLSADEVDEKARSILAQMNLDEKIDQMSGDASRLTGLLSIIFAYNSKPYQAGENKRLDLPGVRFSDGPRGIVMEGATTFPVSAARGATWDVALEEKIGDAMGREARALGANLVAAVCINILRHPAWGRAQETYGEDPYHLGEMGAALVRGLQQHVMACVKHFACNSIEDTRMKVDVQIGERTLREIYLPHFKRCVDEGVSSVMSAYNQVNGVYCAENYHLLREILKDEWGFTGFVLSDFVFGMHDTKASLQAGLDLEMPFTQVYGGKIKRFVQKGEISESLIDESVLRILRQEIQITQNSSSNKYPADILGSAENRALARQAAVESIVLLRNSPPSGQRAFPEQKKDLGALFSFSRQKPMEPYNLRVSDAQRFGAYAGVDMGAPLLPINPYKVKRMAVIGRLANHPNTGDRGSSQTRPVEVINPLRGITDAAQGRFEVVFDEGLSPTEASDIARNADVVVVVVGLSEKDEGENMFTRGGDRQHLRLHSSDVALILTVASVNPRTVVILIGSGMVIMDNWEDYIPAILLVWYPGMEGGYAIADVLFGVANPSGKLPVSFPKSENHLPPFDNRSPKVEYGYYHGYRLLQRRGWEPAFSFGFGLSYTKYAYSNLMISAKEYLPDGMLHATVDVGNIGARAGEEVVQCYIGAPGEAVERPLRELKGFQRVHLEPGEVKSVSFEIPIKNLAYYAEDQLDWQVETGVYAVYIGGSSADADLIHQRFKVKAANV